MNLYLFSRILLALVPQEMLDVIIARSETAPSFIQLPQDSNFIKAVQKQRSRGPFESKSRLKRLSTIVH